MIYAFERALSSLSLMPVLWLLYAKFVWSMGLVTRTRRGILIFQLLAMFRCLLFPLTFIQYLIVQFSHFQLHSTTIYGSATFVSRHRTGVLEQEVGHQIAHIRIMIFGMVFIFICLLGLSVKSCVPAETCILVYKRYIKLVPSARQKFAESLEKLGRHGELMEVLSDMVNSSDDIVMSQCVP